VATHTYRCYVEGYKTFLVEGVEKLEQTETHLRFKDPLGNTKIAIHLDRLIMYEMV